MLEIEDLRTIEDMARGAVLLGTGGGGDPYVGVLFVGAQLKTGRRPRIMPRDELGDDAFVLSVACIGAPTGIVEYLTSEKALLTLLARAESFYGRRIDALISAEIGGANSMIPLAAGAITGVPVLDADGMGRAFPRIEMTTFSIAGCRSTPALMMDEAGNMISLDTVDDRTMESLARAITIEMGGVAMGALYPMSGRQAKRHAVWNTLTLARDIGRTIRETREQSRDIFAELLALLSVQDGREARILFDGKITDVTHETRDGWHFGRATLADIDGTGRTLTVDMQNEFVVARDGGRTVAIVPDLIGILDRETGEPMTAEALAYGQRVKVLGFVCEAALRTPESLEVVGPRCFGLDEDYASIVLLADTMAGGRG